MGKPSIKIPRTPGNSHRANAGGIPSRVGDGTLKKSGALSFGNGAPRGRGGRGSAGTGGFGGSVGNSGGPGWKGPGGPMSNSSGFREKH